MPIREKLSKLDCEQLAERIRPVWFNPEDKQLYYLQRLTAPGVQTPAQKWSFNDSSMRTQRAEGLKAIRHVLTYHRPTDHRFRPTFAEVLEAIEPEDLPRVIAFRTVPRPEEDNKENGFLAGLTTLYAKQ